MEWINNQWIIGIGTSIISGFLVFFFTRKFFTEKQKKEYSQKIKTANNEILYAVRPLIVEKTKPSVDILKSIFVSTARKYGVNSEDIYDKETLCDDLTNEIMSNSFLASEQKIELTTMINELKAEGKKEPKERIITVYKEGKTNSSTTMAMTLALMTAMFALVFTLYSTIKGKDNLDSIFDSSDKIPDSLGILFLALTIPLLAVLISSILKRMRKDNDRVKSRVSELIRRRREQEKKDKGSDKNTPPNNV